MPLFVLFALNYSTNGQVINRSDYKAIIFKKKNRQNQIDLKDYLEITDKSYKKHFGEVLAISDTAFHLGHEPVLFDNIHKIKYKSNNLRTAALITIGVGATGLFLSTYLTVILEIVEEGKLLAAQIMAGVSGALIITGILMATKKSMKPNKKGKEWSYSLVPA